jgi:hypothetical protein
MRAPVESVNVLPVRDVPLQLRRAAVRFPGRRLTPARLAASCPDRRTAWVYNASADGIGLLLPRPLAAAAVLDIDLITASGATLVLRGRVVHATPRIDGRWLVGCQLDAPLTGDELQALLGAAASG